MTTPKKPLSKTESAIQLGRMMAGPRGGGTKKGLIAKAKKLLKIGEKPTKNATPIKEVKKAKKFLKNQKVNKSAKVKDLKILEKKYPEAAMNKRIPAGAIAQGKFNRAESVSKYVGKHAYSGKTPKRLRTQKQIALNPAYENVQRGKVTISKNARGKK
tara:strand:- start:2560 stop:3033 length:474 start_codon:yes stop_codon:yes gene_type:complete